MCNDETVETTPEEDLAYLRLCILQQAMDMGHEIREVTETDALTDLCHDVINAFLLGTGSDKNIEELFNFNIGR
jgi:hypothetical protein